MLVVFCMCIDEQNKLPIYFIENIRTLYLYFDLKIELFFYATSEKNIVRVKNSALMTIVEATESAKEIFIIEYPVGCQISMIQLKLFDLVPVIVLRKNLQTDYFWF